MARTFVRTQVTPALLRQLFDWHARPAAFFRLVPPWEAVEVADIQGPFGDGQRVTLRATLLGPVQKSWVAKLHDVIPGEQFCDTQLSGPFASWDHAHRFRPHPDGSLLEDAVTYRLPFGPLGALGAGLVRAKLAAMFRYRQRLTAFDLARHGRFGFPALKVMVTGSTGLIGDALCHFLASGGHAVTRLVRTPSAKPRLDGTSEVRWHPAEPLDPAHLEGMDAVIHLAGENVAEGRWTSSKKRRIRDSRTGPTAHVAQACKRARVPTLLSASAVGIYGDRGDEPLPEDAKPGTGFFADVGQAWEAATDAATDAGVRVVHLRTGVVLSPKGGALAKQLPAFAAGGGAVVGPGTQWVPWIGLNDELGAIHHCLMTPTLSGPVNLVAPDAVTNRDFGRTLARVLSRPYLLTVPAPALRLLFGELADAALLASTRVVPQKLLDSGFQFLQPTLAESLRFETGRDSD